MTPVRPGDATSAFVDPVSAGLSSDSPTLDLSFLDPPLDAGELGRLGAYRVIRVLGTGGMGIVFEAEDTHLQRPVALKVMRAEALTNPVTRERFLLEARAAAALTSDHIVTVYQVGIANDVPFLAMQYLHGESLQARLERAGPLSSAETAIVARHAAAGLAEAHARGLVHRDIKPANLWLESDGPGGPFKRVKILDFGLARRGSHDTRLTASGVFVGTPHFMAPEQASGELVDGRADLFSLGCVAYTALTGELAFGGSSIMAVLMALANTRPPMLAERVPGVPHRLSDLVDRLLAKSPDDRPARADDVVTALDEMLRDGSLPADALPVVGARPLATANTPFPSQTRSAIHRGSGSTAEASALPPTTPVGPISPVRVGRPWLGGLVAGAGLVAVALAASVFFRGGGTAPRGVAAVTSEPIKVGVLHSMKGTMALSESPVVDATLLAIEELNEAGGVLGRHIKPIVADGASDPAEFASAAERLLAEDGVAALFGCWTSASRKAVKPIVERHGGLLFYPVQYEGLEQSPRIFYFGPAANQQLFPAVDFLTEQLGKRRLFLVGSDYVFPRSAHALIRDRVKERTEVEVVGETFLLLGSREVGPTIEAIRRAQPDAVVNTINGSTNVYYFREFRRAGFTAEKLPTLSVSVTENELHGLDAAAMAGDYLAAGYFQSVDSPESRAFVQTFRARYGADRVVSDAMAAAYSAVHVWAKAATAAGAPDAGAVAPHVRGQTYRGPSGALTVDPETQHVGQPARIGRIKADGQVEVVAGSDRPVTAIPFPATRTRQEWDRFLSDLYVGWDGQWQAPARH